MATITVKDFALDIDTDPRTARKFLRAITPKDAQPGKGARWAIEKRDMRSLRSKFAKWAAEQDEKRKAREEANDAPETPDEGDAPENEGPTDADLEAIEAEMNN